MDQQLPLANIITLGVRDFAREREFYHRPGWPHVFDSDAFTVFELRSALLALFGIDHLGTDAHATPRHATPESGHGGIRSSVIITADRPEDVDALVRRAEQRGRPRPVNDTWVAACCLVRRRLICCRVGRACPPGEAW